MVASLQYERRVEVGYSREMSYRQQRFPYGYIIAFYKPIRGYQAEQRGTESTYAHGHDTGCEHKP